MPLSFFIVWCRWLAVLVCCWAPFTAHCADDFLPSEQAFAFSNRQLDTHTQRLTWSVAAGYHLYKERLSITVHSGNAELLPLVLPTAKQVFDRALGRQVEVYDQVLAVDVRLRRGAPEVPLSVQWQGCADAGLCYPPASQIVNLTLSAVSTEDTGSATAPVVPAASSSGAVDAISSSLASGSVLRTMGVFAVAGLLLAFTPCVLPMVPILSSLIAGQAGPVSRQKGLGLSLAYSLGMALVYAGFGVAAGLAGEGLAAALQNPWVLGGFALLLASLALSMFGVYELQVPSSLQSRATEWSNRFQGGSWMGVFLMGGLSALVVGPCVAAPLAGALVYISQTRDVVLGAAALFAMAMGMSVPLLLVGVSAGSLLPRAGAWMERVKQVFGMMLFAVAIWMLTPVLPSQVQMLVWALWLLGGAGLLGLFASANVAATPTPVLARVGGTALVGCAAVLLLGAASGGQSVLQPLAHWRVSQVPGMSASAEKPTLAFERITSVQALDQALTDAASKGETVMLDFYADWCVACKELDAFTFSNADVQKRLRPVKLLQADVTANNLQDKALLKRFGLFGPPGMVFLDGVRAQPLVHKVVGYQNANDFLASLDLALPR